MKIMSKVCSIVISQGSWVGWMLGFQSTISYRLPQDRKLTLEQKIVDSLFLWRGYVPDNYMLCTDGSL